MFFTSERITWPWYSCEITIKKRILRFYLQSLKLVEIVTWPTIQVHPEWTQTEVRLKSCCKVWHCNLPCCTYGHYMVWFSIREQWVSCDWLLKESILWSSSVDLSHPDAERSLCCSRFSLNAVVPRGESLLSADDRGACTKRAVFLTELPILKPLPVSSTLNAAASIIRAEFPYCSLRVSQVVEMITHLSSDRVSLSLFSSSSAP